MHPSGFHYLCSVQTITLPLYLYNYAMRKYYQVLCLVEAMIKCSTISGGQLKKNRVELFLFFSVAVFYDYFILALLGYFERFIRGVRSCPVWNQKGKCLFVSSFIWKTMKITFPSPISTPGFDVLKVFTSTEFWGFLQKDFISCNVRFPIYRVSCAFVSFCMSLKAAVVDFRHEPLFPV